GRGTATHCPIADRKSTKSASITADRSAGQPSRNRSLFPPGLEASSMGLAPRTDFVRRGNGHLAYQIFGDGPARVLQIDGYATHREQLWQFPAALRGQEHLSRMARVAQYDWRGYGMSDALPTGDYPIEELAAAALAVMDASEWERAVLWGEGG